MTTTDTLQRLLDENSYSLIRNEGRIIEAKQELIKTESNKNWIQGLQRKTVRLKEERTAIIDSLAALAAIQKLTA